MLGQVAGKVWATKKSPALTGQAFLTVRVGERLLVCADCVGAGEGETVLVATGGAARVAAGAELPIDAAIGGILDESQKSKAAACGRRSSSQAGGPTARLSRGKGTYYVHQRAYCLPYGRLYGLGCG